MSDEEIQALQDRIDALTAENEKAAAELAEARARKVHAQEHAAALAAELEKRLAADAEAQQAAEIKAHASADEERFAAIEARLAALEGKT